MESPLVSVVSPTYNNEKLLIRFVNSILKQNFKDFELIIVDDCSTDNSLKILERIRDERIKILKTPKNSGPAMARNIGIKNSIGKYIFFIDGDCIASKNWINEGLKVFEKEKCLGVEGKIYYVSKGYKPTASDDFVENLNGGQFMSGNIAYLKEELCKIGGFNNNLKRMEDRELALKILKDGRIIFSPKMLVIHQKFKLKFNKKINSILEGTKARVYLFKNFKDKPQIFFRIYNPINLFYLIFPLMILGVLFKYKYRSLEDVKTLFWIYPAMFIERITLWKTAIKEKVFLI
jgi:glycosyltransferase involved in cell wall biosynthesis